MKDGHITDENQVYWYCDLVKNFIFLSQSYMDKNKVELYPGVYTSLKEAQKDKNLIN